MRRAVFSAGRGGGGVAAGVRIVALYQSQRLALYRSPVAMKLSATGDEILQ